MLHYTMKRKMSITINEDTIKLLEKLVTEGRFRNKSHLIEYSVMKFLQEDRK